MEGYGVNFVKPGAKLTETAKGSIFPPAELRCWQIPETGIIAKRMRASFLILSKLNFNLT